MPIVLTRATKLEARYKALGGAEHCSACRFYMPQGTCGRIIGPVSPEGWCKYYSREAVQRWSNPGYAGSGGGLPAGVTLNLNFMTPGTLDPRIVFTRASTATYFDATGTMQTANNDTPRWDYDPVTLALKGLLLEVSRTNLLLNSATLGTQTVAASAQPYVLSFYGAGTITLSGAFAGSLVGNGSFPARVFLPFTPAAGTLTLTVTGSVLNAQLEVAQSFPTSYIPTTGATATRAIDSCTIQPASMGWFTAPGGSWFAEFISLNPAPTVSTRVVGRIGATGITPLFVNSSRLMGQSDGASVLTANALTGNAVTKAASNWASGRAAVCGNANAVVSSASLATGYALLSGSGVYFLTSATVPADSCLGYLRHAAYWPRVLTDAEMQQVTT